ncbi:MAG: integrase [SAR324 cluster bacterium]|nr:integrase [SAR324 cluster bacterium]
MSTMISEVYEAFKEAGASDEKSKKAAEALANYENRFSRIETTLVEIKGELVTLKWMFGFVLAGIASLIIKTFF